MRAAAAGQLCGAVPGAHSVRCADSDARGRFDHHIDYKTIADKDALVAAIKEVAPDGIDMNFENVGGMHFEAAMESLKKCGNENRPTRAIAATGGPPC